MKQGRAVPIAAALLALVLSACGGGNDFPEDNTGQPGAGNPNTNPSTGTTPANNQPPPPPPVTNTDDTTRPTVSMLLPLNNATVSGGTTLLADANDNVAVSYVQFRVNDEVLGPQLTVRPYSMDFDTTYLSNGVHSFSARAVDTAGNFATSSTRRVRVANTCRTASPDITQWQNVNFDGQEGVFTAQWDVTPLAAGMDGVIGLARGSANNWSDLAVSVRFNRDNGIDAINGSAYSTSAPMSYTPNVTYHVRVEVNIPQRSYSAFVSAGGAEQAIAQNFSFRSEQSGTSRLDYWVVEAEAGALRACAFQVAGQTPPPPPPPTNQPPVADAGGDQTVNENTGVQLNGSASQDSDNGIGAYAWTQTAGPAVALSGADSAMPTFTAPEVAGATLLSFQLTVTDNAGAQASDTTNVTVNDTAPPPPENSPPMANAGGNQLVAERSTVTLDGGQSSDSDGTIMSYLWSQTAGPAVALTGADSVMATFVAPDTADATGLSFMLTVTDNGGAQASAGTDITVTNIDAPPPGDDRAAAQSI